MSQSGARAEKQVAVAESCLATFQRAYDAEPSVETAMMLDAARRRLYLARRDLALGRLHNPEEAAK